MHDAALQTTAPDVDCARLAALELEVAERARDVMRLKSDLLALQSRYLDEIGGLYAKLNELETAIADAEIAAGLRPPPGTENTENTEDDTEGPRTGDIGAAAGCGHRAAPSADLKRIFRQLAKTIHPDLALDGAARYRRHSLMAEANRAYAERDEDRLRLILSKWERGDPSTALGAAEPSADDDDHVRRRVAALEERRVAIDAEMRDLRTSAIWRLNTKIEDARKQGWDLFAEMVREVQREVRRAAARLAHLQKQRG